MPQDAFDGSGRPPGHGDLVGRFESVRRPVRELSPEAVSRQLPNLVETLANLSLDGRRTLQFVVGVSFSRNRTLFDYRLDRLVEVDGRDEPRLETVKPPVSSSHRYLSFPYPPDPEFDAAALRGALLSTIERELARSGEPAMAADSADAEAPGDPSWFAQLRAQLGGQR